VLTVNKGIKVQLEPTGMLEFKELKELKEVMA
jgi:hypothetical protein